MTAGDLCVKEELIDTLKTDVVTHTNELETIEKCKWLCHSRTLTGETQRRNVSLCFSVRRGETERFDYLINQSPAPFSQTDENIDIYLCVGKNVIFESL